MLIATQAKSIEGTEKYFDTVLAKGDYYIDGAEVGGAFQGNLATLLGVEGMAASREPFSRLLRGFHPTMAEKLVQRLAHNRRPGTDLTFSPPKSFSVWWALFKDERLIQALRDTVRETMEKDVQPLMCRRVRAGGQAASKDRTPTGSLAWVDFLHLTARPVEGKVDPHLHIHAFVMNLTADGGKFYAAEMEEIVRQRPSLQAKFEARLAHRMQHELGIPVEKTRFLQGGRMKAGWEIRGIDRGLIEKFSARTQQVEAHAAEYGVIDAAEKGKLGVRTRAKKEKGQSIEQLHREWRSRLTEAKREQLDGLRSGAIGAEVEAPVSKRAAESIRYALDHHLYRQSTVEKQAVIGAALEHGLTLLPEEVEAALDSQEVIQRPQDVRGAARDFVTTHDVLDAERRMIAFARDGRGTRMPIGRGVHTFKRDWMNAEQKQAVRSVLESRHTIMAVMGAAGTGKSTLMSEAAEAIETLGKKLFVFAPSTGAREVLEEKGFPDAQTTEHLLRNEKLHEKLKDHVLWIDEAGQLDVRTMNGIFDIAKAQNCRVVLSGDTRQHASPRRGEAMRLLEKEAGLQISRVETIQRQQGDYKRAVELIGRGDEIVDKQRGLSGLVAGFDLLDRLGKIKEIRSEERHAVLAQQYLAAPPEKTPLVVAPTHAEGRSVTDHIRHGLRERGAIGTEEREFLQLSSLNLSEAQKSAAVTYTQPGMMIQFHQNVAGGFKRGGRYRVEQQPDGAACLKPLGGGLSKPIPLTNPERFEVYRENKIGFAVGDKVRFSLGGTATDKKRRISNGRLDEIAGFDRQGNLRLKSGMTVAKDYGHLDLGYVTTSHAAQGKDRETAIAAMGSQSLAAVNARQFYVTVSRGQKDVAIYVDDKQAIRQAIQNRGEQRSATELVKMPAPEARQPLQQRDRQRRAIVERARQWWDARIERRDRPTAQPSRPRIPIHTQLEPGRG
ncbi:MobF family relaxase [Botrimarina hoheduenensis]|uniref:Multifunctional conjugation protein TraI n=1 Tax=Botrimarina hoheduenensis TaxID=2528000 RepID=A0A5C5VUV5_9BACT|nr:MobF family relaxase [Botrimarina hoheduenensis]TWT41391.1 Multifunctional conjugation protein TraI [Botrimarina hoheduenensis]